MRCIRYHSFENCDFIQISNLRSPTNSGQTACIMAFAPSAICARCISEVTLWLIIMLPIASLSIASVIPALYLVPMPSHETRPAHEPT